MGVRQSGTREARGTPSRRSLECAIANEQYAVCMVQLYLFQSTPSLPIGALMRLYLANRSNLRFFRMCRAMLIEGEEVPVAREQGDVP